jgi:hypothetical protein
MDTIVRECILKLFSFVGWIVEEPIAVKLPPKIHAGPSIGILIFKSVYRTSIIYSVA